METSLAWYMQPRTTMKHVDAADVDMLSSLSDNDTDVDKLDVPKAAAAPPEPGIVRKISYIVRLR